jgi:hypothetical protein
MRFLLVSFLILLTHLAFAGIGPINKPKNIKYRSYSGECPTKPSDLFSLLVMKEFEKRHSLKDVKEKILNEKLDEKHFVSNYRINFNPVENILRLTLECPRPLLKVQVYKTNGEEHYSAILADNGKLYEPGYELIMKVEKRLTSHLPLLAISSEQLEGPAPLKLATLMTLMDKELRALISEIIVSKNHELSIVFALGGKATSVFMGAEDWEEKLIKLSKIIGYVNKNKRYPGSINLVNSKKVVVKFSDNI